MIYRDVKQDDILSIAKIHSECFKDYFITKLGDKLIARYYAAFLGKKSEFILCENDGEIIGFALFVRAGQTSQVKKKFIKKNFLSLSLRAAGLILKGEKGLAKRLGSQNQDSPEPQNIPTLLSIAVLPAFRGGSVSNELLKRGERRLVECGDSRYYLTVRRSNTAAIRFYERAGMTPLSEIGDDVYYVKEVYPND